MALDADTMQEIVDYADLWDVEVREDYSGRGMYGKSVPALVGDGNPIAVAIEFAWAAANMVADGEIDVDVSDLPTRSDSMGLGFVLYRL